MEPAQVGPGAADQRPSATATGARVDPYTGRSQRLEVAPGGAWRDLELASGLGRGHRAPLLEEQQGTDQPVGAHGGSIPHNMARRWPVSVRRWVAYIHDPRPDLDQALTTFESMVAAVRHDHLAAATPCAEWSVRDLLGHMVCVARRIAVVGRGEPGANVALIVHDVPDSDWLAAWRGAATEARDVWRNDPDLLAAIVHPPFGDMPGAAAAIVYVTGVLVHAWDLATAVGADPVWDDAVVLAGLGCVHGGFEADGRSDELTFDDAVPASEDAPVIARLVAFCGRRPTHARV